MESAEQNPRLANSPVKGSSFRNLSPGLLCAKMMRNRMAQWKKQQVAGASGGDELGRKKS